MTLGVLTPEIPLGPFEGTPITVWSAPGKQARLHSSRRCSYLRSARAQAREVPLDAAVMDRMCPRCAEYGRWARPGTGLDLFLEALTGLGLVYELDRYGKDDEDACCEEDIERAAALLHKASAPGQEPDEENDDDWEALREAQQVRTTVVGEWRDAAASLHRSLRTLALFPWLEPWTRTRMRQKAGRLETIRGQAQRLIVQEYLMLAADVSAMEEPPVPAADPAFAALGSADQIRQQLLSLWRRWRGKVTDSWDDPREQAYLVHFLMDGMGNRRKGREEALARAQELLQEWTAAARCAAQAAQEERTLVVRLPAAAARRGHGDAFLHDLDEWELGVLVAFMVEADWDQLRVVLRVPQLIADRLLSPRSALACEASSGSAIEQGPSAAEEPLGPGVFDDTPVYDRRLVTAGHLRALRAASPDPDQLYLVFSRELGAEVLPLTVVERRCAAGWQGVLLAGASDLPRACFPARQAHAGVQAVEEDGGIWPSRVREPRDPQFGRSLSAAEGERVLARLCEGRRDGQAALRSLALARGVRDLREFEAEYDEEDRRRGPFPRDVWHGLLAMEQLDLEPFEAASQPSRWSGSDLPLGVLGVVQIYTTDATGQYEGRAHSPACTHTRHWGVTREDDLATVADLLGNEQFDACSKCGGYAVRRLSPAQVDYYRAAHRLHRLIRSGEYAVREQRPADAEPLLEELTELEGLRTAKAWFTSPTEARRWWRAVHQLRQRLQATAHASPGPLRSV